MTRRAATSIAVLIFLALLALLIYSLDRTSWLLAQYEVEQPGTLAHYLGLSPLALGVAAALVIEVGAVALVAGDVLALERSAIKRYATAGLAVVLSVQALANLLAGFLRGYASVQATLQAHGATADVAQRIAWLSWVLSSAAVPALIFILSKLAAHVVQLALSMPANESTVLSDESADDMPVLTPDITSLSNDNTTVPSLRLLDSTPLSKREQVKALAIERGVSVSTIWRHVKQGAITLEGDDAA